jgi:hypothetical protein
MTLVVAAPSVCGVIGLTEENELGMMESSTRGNARPRADRVIQATNEEHGNRRQLP